MYFLRPEILGEGEYLELLLFRRGSHPRQHMLEWRSRDPEIAAEWVAEGDNQDEHQDAGSGQHSRHCELHPQARRTEERTEGDRQSSAGDHHEPRTLPNVRSWGEPDTPGWRTNVNDPFRTCSRTSVSLSAVRVSTGTSPGGEVCRPATDCLLV